jgi:hypothetical protein
MPIPHCCTFTMRIPPPKVRQKKSPMDLTTYATASRLYGEELRAKAGECAFRATAATAFFTPLLLPPLGVALHCWTVLLVAGQGMDLPTVLAAVFLPGIAELALGALYWEAAGVLHPYCVGLLVYGGLWGAGWLSVALLIKVAPLPGSPEEKGAQSAF